MQPELTVIILSKNEAANIQDCVASVRDIASEILVADGESTDNTRELAREAGATVLELPVWQGWGHKRREAQQHATKDYILHLDADERLTPELKAELKEALSKATGTEIFAIPRANHLFGERIRHCGWYPDYVLRCYRRQFTQYNEAKVHEKLLLPEGARIVYLRNPLIHYTYASVEQCLNKQKNYALSFAEDRVRRHKTVSLWTIPLRGLFTFIRVYFLRQGFRDGRWGLWNAISSATYTVNKYLALYAAAHDKKVR